MSDALVFRSLAHEPGLATFAPQKPKSQIMQMYERMTGGAIAQTSVAMQRIQQTGQMVRGGGEAFLTGLIMGLIDSEIGLDKTKIPLDAIAAGLSMGGSFYFAGDPSGVSHDLANIGSDCLAILTYRKTKAIREREHKQPAGEFHGNSGDDELLKAASNLFDSDTQP